MLLSSSFMYVCPHQENPIALGHRDASAYGGNAVRPLDAQSAGIESQTPYNGGSTKVLADYIRTGDGTDLCATGVN